MQLQDYDTTTRYTAKVLNNQRITSILAKEEVRDIMIEVEHPGFDVQVGQNIGVLAPGRKEIGQQHHFRLYSVADIPTRTDHGSLQLTLCVKRCSYIDEFSGERYPGIASNYLCDLQPGDELKITGPYGQAFDVPEDPRANLILIGAGTGIAPFRAFVKHIYFQRPDFGGRIWLFHGGQTGLDLLYRNEEKDDFSLYYDHDTFEAIDVLSNRPGWSDLIDWGLVMGDRREELCKLLSDPHTYVYVAGIEKIRNELDDALAEVAGSNHRWFQLKSELEAERRWVELLY